MVTFDPGYWSGGVYGKRNAQEFENQVSRVLAHFACHSSFDRGMELFHCFAAVRKFSVKFLWGTKLFCLNKFWMNDEVINQRLKEKYNSLIAEISHSVQILQLISSRKSNRTTLRNMPKSQAESPIMFLSYEHVLA